MEKIKKSHDESLREEGIAIVERGNPSLEEIRKMMKKSGKSFAQIMRDTKKLSKDVAAAKAEAEAKGECFSEAAYLKTRMNQR